MGAITLSVVALACLVIFNFEMSVEAKSTMGDIDVGEFMMKDGRVILIKEGAISSSDLGARACECYCKEKWSSEMVWVCCNCEFAQNGCFPSTATVTSKTGNIIKMADLRVREYIQAVDEEGTLVYSKVLGFLHRTSQVTKYLSLETDSGKAISLSESHLIFSRPQNETGQLLPKYASTLSVGDIVSVATQGELKESKVQRISEVYIEGAFVPLTAEGTLVVNGVFASCYASFAHDLAHAVMAPVRWFPWLMYRAQEDEGVPSYVQLVKSVGRTILPLLT